jgi:hypothetical protein
LISFKDDILEIIESNEPPVIQKYLEDYLVLLGNKIDHYTSELITQSTTCPLTLPSLEIIDQRLKEFVRLHHLDLLRTISYQLSQLNSLVLINKFSKQLSTFQLTTKQVRICNGILVTFSSFNSTFF